MDKVLETLKEDYTLRASLKRKHLKVQDELEDEIDDLELSLITSKIIPELEQYAKTLLRDLECEVYLAIKKDANGDVEVADELSFIPTHTPQQKAKPITQPVTSSATPSGAIPVPHNPNADLVVTFPDGTVFDDDKAISTFIKTIQKIGLEEVAKVGIDIKGYNLVDTRKRTDKGYTWQKNVGKYYIYSYLSNGDKVKYLNRISNHYNLGLKIETK